MVYLEIYVPLVFFFIRRVLLTGIFPNKYLLPNRASNGTVKSHCGSKNNRIIWNVIPTFVEDTSNLKGLSFKANVVW